jgi:hypothetical protein
MTGAAPEERDEAFVEEEEQEAAEEAARIGGNVPKDTDDPAEQPLLEGGEGESEGFELAEKDLEDIAEHGDEHQFPTGTPPPEEAGAETTYGEADQEIQPDGSDEGGE